MPSSLLRVSRIHKSFGGVKAIQDVSFEARPNQIVAIIGPNGAGKTTLFNMISGVFLPDRGSIWINGQNLRGVPPYQVARQGVSRTFQNVQVFGNMTVLENVAMGRFRHEHTPFMGAILGLGGGEEDSTRQAAMRYLKRVGLSEKAELPASSLPLGEQRLMELARALASEPSLVLLDEPTAGLNAVETVRLAATVKRLQANEVTVLLVEHDMNLVMSVADWVVVLDYGEKLAEGRPEGVQHDPRVIEAYMGEDNGNNGYG